MMTMTTPGLESEVPLERWYGVYTALVIEVADPEGLGRVKVHLPWSADRGGPSPAQKDSAAQPWARLATLAAGAGRGVWIRPDVGDEVLVAFEGGDPSHPYVVGCLWNGQDRPPSGADDSPDNNTKLIRTRSGLQILMDDSNGSERLKLSTPSGVSVTLEDEDGMVEIADNRGNRVRLNASGVEVSSPDKVVVSAATVEIQSGAVTVTAGMATFQGVVKCDTLIANSVVASSYTPGAGNIL